MALDESQQQMVIFMGPGGSNCYLRMRTWLEYGQYIWMSCEENDRGNEGGNMMAIPFLVSGWTALATSISGAMELT